MYKIKNYIIKLIWKLTSNTSKHGFRELNIPNIIIDEVLKEFGKIEKDDLILDAGCGGGFLCNSLAKLSYKVVGIDYVLKFNKNYNGSFIICDIKHLPFKSSIFDKIICYSVLQYIGPKENILKVLKEFYRILKSGKKIFIGEIVTQKGYFNDHLISSDIPIIRKILLFFYLNIVYQYYFYPRDEWISMFNELNFKYHFVQQDTRMPYHKNMVHCLLEKNE
ncbi:MAG: methyltransferase domain-containing protein [Candidatus Hydrogenedentota bacterium]